MKMEIPFQDLSQSRDVALADLEEAALRVIRSGRFLHGKETENFESELAAVCKTRYCVAVSTGLDAIRLMLRAYMEAGQLAAGDEVMFPANTFIASVLPITDLGLTAVPVDVSEATFNLDFEEVKRKLTPRTKAIVVVHLYGTPAWDAGIMRYLNDRGILILEDNAQAIGAEVSGGGLHSTTVTGGLGHCGAISFYPGKNIGALGDAGAVVTNDPEIARLVRMLANYGSEKKYYNMARGYNCRMDEIQAAMLRVKLRNLDKISERRGKIASLYDRLISNPAIVKPRIIPQYRQVWHQYVISTPERDRLREYLKENGIGSEIHYPVAVHKQPCYNEYFKGVEMPVAEKMSGQVLSLPIANVTEKEAGHIAEVINRFQSMVALK